MATISDLHEIYAFQFGFARLTSKFVAFCCERDRVTDMSVAIKLHKTAAQRQPMREVGFCPCGLCYTNQLRQRLVFIRLPPCQLGFDILRGQPDKLTKAIDSLLRNAYAGQLLAELLPCPPGDRLLVLPADIVAVVPQQPRFLMLFQRQRARRQLAVEYSTGRTRAIDEPFARDCCRELAGWMGLPCGRLPGRPFFLPRLRAVAVNCAFSANAQLTFRRAAQIGGGHYQLLANKFQVLSCHAVSPRRL
jgi:hypothetical protein